MAAHTLSKEIPNELGIATLSLGSPKHHSLPDRLRAASAAGFKAIDLFDGCWAAHLESLGQDPSSLWDATPQNLQIARDLTTLVHSLGMRIACTQPLRNIEGCPDPEHRAASFAKVAARFPFMRAWQTDLVFMCASTDAASGDFQSVARDLAELGKLAEAYSRADGGPLLRIGYEGLSWARRNTWMSSWEVVRAANRGNVGLVVDAFNLLAVEYADPYNPAGHGRFSYETEEEARAVLGRSLGELVKCVPGNKIFFVQLADAELVDVQTFRRPEDPGVPALLPWSRGYRLFPMERERGAYLPVEMVTAAVLATGYEGPLSLEVFNDSLEDSDPDVPRTHAERGKVGLKNVIAAAAEDGAL